MIEIGRKSKEKTNFLICFMITARDTICYTKDIPHSLLRHNYAMFTREVALP